jgi:hypothetical protein
LLASGEAAGVSEVTVVLLSVRLTSVATAGSLSFSPTDDLSRACLSFVPVANSLSSQVGQETQQLANGKIA